MKNNRGNAIIAIVIVVFVIDGILILASQNIPEENNVIIESNVNIEEEKKVIEVSKISFEENDIEIDIKENKTLILQINPSNVEKDNFEYISTNSEIATIEKNIYESDYYTIAVKVQPISEGECEVFVKYKEIETNKIKVKVIDTERIERERKEAEEQAEREAREQAERERKQQTTTKTNNSNNSHGRTVYRTPSGKRYHFDPDCGGKNSYQITLDAAKSSGLTPCKKCAQ